MVPGVGRRRCGHAWSARGASTYAHSRLALRGGSPKNAFVFQISAFASLLLAAVFSAGAADAPSVRGVTFEPYGGWREALMMRGGDCKLVVVPPVGGRVLSWSVNGENIIYENTSVAGRTLSNSPAGFSPGGSQCDIGPELRGIPPHQDLWVGNWTGTAPKDYVIRVASPADMTVGLQIEREFTMDPQTGELGLVQLMRNVINNDTTFCLWDRTLCKSGGFALLPLNKKSRFPARWSIRRGKSGSYTYDGQRPADARARVMDNVLVVQARDLPDARELKVGTDTADGWIGYVRGRVLFVKFFPVFPRENYTDGGNTLEFYCSERVAELEPLSPEIRLTAGKEYRFPEKWVLIDLGQEITTYEQARAVVKQIDKSPFK